MFENPSGGRQARDFTANVLKILNCLPNRYSLKIDVGCPLTVHHSASKVVLESSEGRKGVL